MTLARNIGEHSGYKMVGQRLYDGEFGWLWPGTLFSIPDKTDKQNFKTENSDGSRVLEEAGFALVNHPIGFLTKLDLFYEQTGFAFMSHPVGLTRKQDTNANAQSLSTTAAGAS